MNIHKMKDLIDGRASAWEDGKKLLKLAATENREMTSEEQVQYKRIEADVDSKSEQIDAEERALERDKKLARKIDTENQAKIGMSGGRNGDKWVDAATGREVRIFRKGDSIADACDGTVAGVSTAELSIGRLLRAVAVGDWSQAPNERRALGESVNASGGFMVPAALSSFVVDRARNESILGRLGMQTLPMPGETLSVAKVSGDASFTTKVENAAFAESDMTFSRLLLTSRTIGTITRASRELIEDAPNAASEIERALVTALSVEIDRLGLAGDGDAEPIGILNASINTIAVGGALTYDEILDGMEDCRDGNDEPDSFVTTAALSTSLSKLLRNSEANNYASPPVAVSNLRHLTSNQMPSGTVVIGGFQNVLMGVRLSPRVEITQDSDGFAKHQILFKTFWRGDFGVIHPTQLTSLTGAT